MFFLDNSSLLIFRQEFSARSEFGTNLWNNEYTPRDKLLIVVDALYANTPFIRLVQSEQMKFITVVKPRIVDFYKK